MFNLVGHFKRHKAAYIIFSIALLIRLIHIIEISNTRPFYLELYNDAKVSDQWGREIAAGNILGKGVAEQDPLYAYSLGLIYFIIGRDLLTVIILQAIIGAFASVLVYSIASRLFNSKVGTIAAILWSFHTVIIFYECLIMKEGLSVFLTLLAIYIIVIARDTPYYRYWFWGGVVIGLSALTRGNILLLIPFLCIWLFLNSGKKFCTTYLSS